MISIQTYRASVGSFYSILEHLTNGENVVSSRSGNVHVILLFLIFSFLDLPILLHAFCTLFIGNY